MSRFEFGSLLATLEEELCARLTLTPMALPAGLGEAQGRFRGEDVRLEVRAYRGPRVRYARFVTIAGGGLEIGNALALPSAALGSPIFGVDLVDLGKETAAVIADLSPVLPAIGPSPTRTDGPAWAQPWLSAEALLARIAPAERERAAASVRTRATAFVDAVATAPFQPDGARAVDAAHRAYARSHKEDDRGLGLLGKMFYPSFAAAFLEQVLFPEELPS